MRKLIGILSLLIIITSCDIDLKNKGVVKEVNSAITDNRYLISIEFENINYGYTSDSKPTYTEIFDLSRPFNIGDSLILDNEIGVPIGYVKDIGLSLNHDNVILVNYRKSGTTQTNDWFINRDNKFKVGDDVYIRRIITDTKIEKGKSNNKFIE